MNDVAYVLGQWSERLLAMGGWIGEHPADGGDVAHLLVYPTGHGVADRMRAVAALLGLVPATTAGDPPLVAAEQARLASTGGGWLQLYVGDTMVAERPITAEWIDVATARGWAVLTVGQDGHSGRPQEQERYLSRPQRLHLGRLVVDVPTPVHPG